MLDHEKTAQELDLIIGHYLMLTSSLADKTQALENLAMLKGLSNWHRSEAGDTQALTPENLEHAAKKLLKPNPMLGMPVTILKDPYFGHEGVIESANFNGTCNVRISPILTIENLRPGIDLGFKTKAQKSA